MQTKISKTLEGLIARTAFDTSKQGETRWLKDRLLLEIVREEGSLAYQLLSARLKDWELYQVRLRIERDLQERTDGPAGNPEEFYVQFANELRKRYRTAPSVSTAHALHAIISDERRARIGNVPHHAGRRRGRNPPHERGRRTARRAARPPARLLRAGTAARRRQPDARQVRRRPDPAGA